MSHTYNKRKKLTRVKRRGLRDAKDAINKYMEAKKKARLEYEDEILADLLYRQRKGGLTHADNKKLRRLTAI